jgi:MFS family permease
MFRLGIGALPFLLPLLMQIGFGLSPFHSGLVTFSSSLGAMGMKTLAARLIRAFGFRNLMTVNAIVSAFFLGVCALFTVTTPLLIIMVILVVGGFFRSLEFTAINTVAYADVESPQMSRATTLVSVNQQLAVSAGVAVGAASVETTMWLNHVSELNATVFMPAFIVVALTSAASSWFFWQMPADAGHEISGRKAIEVASRKGAAKSAASAAVKAATEDTQDMRDQRLG